MAPTPRPVSAGRAAPNPLRRRLQWPGLVGFGVVAVGLFVDGPLTLRLLWQVVIPLLPISFFLSPSLWRAACPLATAGLLAAERGGGSGLSRPGTETAGVVGLLLLILLVPLRHLVLEHDPMVLLVLLGLLLGLAVVLGRDHTMKSGFCNSICPVLPVERLYGQAPLLQLGDLRCGPCSRCTPAGCPDRAPRQALLSMVGEGPGWVLRPYGAFVLGFPGFIIGFGLLPAGATLTVWHAYASPLGGLLLCWLSLGVLILNLRLSVRDVAPWAAWAAGSCYYWFATVGFTAALGLSPSWVAGFRLLMLGGLALWLWLALTRLGRRAETAEVGD